MDWHTVTGAEVALDLPSSWEGLTAPSPGVDLLALEPPWGGFRANVVVVTGEVSDDFATWQRDNDILLAETLTDYVLLDLERREVAGQPGARRLAIYTAPQDHSVTIEQRVVLHRGRGISLTCTWDTLAYGAEYPLVSRIADSLRWAAAS